MGLLPQRFRLLSHTLWGIPLWTCDHIITYRNSDRRVRISCAERKVSGVIRERRRWMIPVDTRKPSIIDTFMEAYDFGKKTVIPFATSGESPIDDVRKNIRLLEPRATVAAGKRLEADTSGKVLRSWASE